MMPRVQASKDQASSQDQRLECHDPRDAGLRLECLRERCQWPLRMLGFASVLSDRTLSQTTLPALGRIGAPRKLSSDPAQSSKRERCPAGGRAAGWVRDGGC